MSTGSSSLFRPRSRKSRPREVVCPEDSNPGIAAMPGIHFAQVRATISLAEVLNLIGFVPREASGDQVRGPCPVHRSSSPSSRSFSAHLNRHIYKMLSMWIGGEPAGSLCLCDRIEPLRGGPRSLRAAAPGDPPDARSQTEYDATRSDRPVKSSRDQAGICTLDSL
jgi:hypothetical protein